MNPGGVKHPDQHVLERTAQRLEAAAEEVQITEDAARAARERRDGLIVEAVDLEGMSTNAIARYAHISQSRVMAIVARGD